MKRMRIVTIYIPCCCLTDYERFEFSKYTIVRDRENFQYPPI